MALLGYLSLNVLSLAHANCTTDYDQALRILEEALEKAKADQHPDPKAFSTEFQKAVKQLESDQCRLELINLVQVIQTRQQQAPSPTRSTMPSDKPIED